MGRYEVTYVDPNVVIPGDLVVDITTSQGYRYQMLAPGARVALVITTKSGKSFAFGDGVGNLAPDRESRVGIIADRGHVAVRAARALRDGILAIWDGMVAGCIAVFEFVTGPFRK